MSRLALALLLASGGAAEDDRHCSRLYSQGEDRFSDKVGELRYFSADDGKRNKSLQASSELEAIARRIAGRGLP